MTLGIPKDILHPNLYFFRLLGMLRMNLISIGCQYQVPTTGNIQRKAVECFEGWELIVVT